MCEPAAPAPGAPVSTMLAERPVPPKRGLPARCAITMARRAPVTVVVVAALWVVGAATGSLVGGPPHALRAAVGSSVAAVRAGHWWTALTSVPWCSQLLGYLATSVATAVLLPAAERRLGSARTAVAMLVLQVVGVAGGIAGVALVHGGSRWVTQLDRTVMLGPSAAGGGGVVLA